MKYKKSTLDILLQDRIEQNKGSLKETLNSTLQEELFCLEEIKKSISHCKNNIAELNKQIGKTDISNVTRLSEFKAAFEDNLVIWNTLGHIQLASIEMKEYTKRLSVNKDNWERHETIKAAYTSIYETSKRIIDSTAKVMKFINSKYPHFDSATFKDLRRDLTKFREDNSEMLKSTRNAISAHRDEDVCTQIEMIENIGLADAVQLIIEYEHILNELGTAVSPVKQLGICQLQSVFGE